MQNESFIRNSLVSGSSRNSCWPVLSLAYFIINRCTKTTIMVGCNIELGKFITYHPSISHFQMLRAIKFDHFWPNERALQWKKIEIEIFSQRSIFIFMKFMKSLLSKSLWSAGISSIKMGLLRSRSFSNLSKKFSSSAFRISILLSPDSMYSIKYLACSGV